ncbi:hypothetical protein [Pseudolabrys sp. Root1462]|uniref:hypothetical protein n=1 Tax=Pseudolabrys sp. Root1462 TaxID=1736466 RepID=UPI00138F5E5E|nr:hypothetical protein [Pseudolabrys sp. Root1462]
MSKALRFCVLFGIAPLCPFSLSAQVDYLSHLLLVTRVDREKSALPPLGNAFEPNRGAQCRERLRALIAKDCGGISICAVDHNNSSPSFPV